MLSKRRWALNPRKWFGSISSAARKRDKKVQADACIVQLPPPPKQTRPTPPAPIIPHITMSRSKTKITPTPSNNDTYSNNIKLISTSFAPLQSSASNLNQEKPPGPTQISPTLFRRANTLLPTRFGPSIQNRCPNKEELLIDTKRRNTQTINCDNLKLITALQYISTPQQNATQIQLPTNMLQELNQNLFDRPRCSSSNYIGKSSVSRLSHSPSPSSLSIDNNDGRDGSSSSGVFTDERADVNDRPSRKASRDTLSTLDALSVESIDDSQTSLNQHSARRTPCQYRLPLSTFQSNENRPARLRSATSIARSHRAHSAENVLKENAVTIVPVVNRTRQSSAAIVKKIEKRIPPGRSSSTEKIGLVRITNDAYRLTPDKEEHLYRRQRRSSVVSYTNHDDSLPPADDEESYAALPRTSSTEQLSNNVQNDLRAMVDDCLRPMAATMNKTSRSTTTHHRSKRSHTNQEHMQIDIEDITDRLLSSIDCSTYAQYQRCF